jgi:hypothetical protein
VRVVERPILDYAPPRSFASRRLLNGRRPESSSLDCGDETGVGVLRAVEAFDLQLRYVLRLGTTGQRLGAVALRAVGRLVMHAYGTCLEVRRRGPQQGRRDGEHDDPLRQAARSMLPLTHLRDQARLDVLVLRTHCSTAVRR